MDIQSAVASALAKLGLCPMVLCQKKAIQIDFSGKEYPRGDKWTSFFAFRLGLEAAGYSVRVDGMT